MREVFVRDSAIFLHDGKLIIPNFSEGHVSDVTPEETYAMLNKLHQIADIKDCEKVPFALDGGNVLVWNKVKGAETLIVAGKYGHELLRDQAYFQQYYPGRVIPLPIKPEFHERIFHADQIVANLPDGSVLAYSEPLLNQSYADVLRTRFGNNLIRADRETGDKGGMNLISIGSSVVMPYCSGHVRKSLEQRGMNVITPHKLGLPEGSFSYAAGGPHCITLQVPHQLLREEVLKDIASRNK
jgi:N-dimethylarginine dimethylaminohydrolase